MKNFEGYLKRKFGDSYVLLAGGGEKLLSSFAFRNTWNDLLNNTNEFTFASSLYSGAIWMNYRTASGSTDGAITQYLFGDGAGSYADVVAKGFKVNGADDTSVVLAGGSTKALSEFKIGDYLPYYRHTASDMGASSFSANSLDDGWHDFKCYVNDCGTTNNHGTLIQNTYNGTPFLIWIPDTGYYIYKRYNAGSIGGTWSKIYAGYADTIPSHTLWGNSFNGTQNLTGYLKVTSSSSNPDAYNIIDSSNIITSKRGYTSSGEYTYWSAEQNGYEIRIYDNGNLNFAKFKGNDTFNASIITSNNVDDYITPYYWANIKISKTLSETTTPIFANGTKLKGSDSDAHIKLDFYHGTTLAGYVGYCNNSNGLYLELWNPVIGRGIYIGTGSSMTAAQPYYNDGAIRKMWHEGNFNPDNKLNYYRHRYISSTSELVIDANNIADGWHDVFGLTTNGGTTVNHGTIIQNSYNSTPFLLFIADTDVKYVYKRYKSSGTWSSWFKLSAGYADTAGSAATISDTYYWADVAISKTLNLTTSPTLGSASIINTHADLILLANTLDNYAVIRFGHADNYNAVDMFLNGTQRTADGGVGNFTIRNNDGKILLKSTAGVDIDKNVTIASNYDLSTFRVRFAGTNVGAGSGYYICKSGSNIFCAANDNGARVYLESTYSTAPYFRNLNGDYIIYHSGNLPEYQVTVNGTDYSLIAGGKVDIGSYFPFYKKGSSSTSSSNVANANTDFSDGITYVWGYVDNCGTTINHGLLILDTYCSTKFQIWNPDNSLYWYKRYNSTLANGTWSKMYAGYADSIPSHTLWGNTFNGTLDLTSCLTVTPASTDAYNIQNSSGVITSKRGYYAGGGYTYWSAELNYYELRIYDEGKVTFNKFSGTGTFAYDIIHTGNYTNYVYSKSDSDTRYVNVTGDNMTGNLTMSYVSGSTQAAKINFINSSGSVAGYVAYNENSYGNYVELWNPIASCGIYIGTSGQLSAAAPYFNSSSGLKVMYHAGNLPAYPTKASWNYDDVYLKKTVTSTASSGSGVYITDNGNSWAMRSLQILAPKLSTGSAPFICVGKSDGPRNMGQIYFYYSGTDNSNSNRISMGLHSVDDVFNIMGSGYVGVGTTNPSLKLDVAGHMHLGGSLYITNVAVGNYNEGIRIANTISGSYSTICVGSDPSAITGTHTHQWQFGRDASNQWFMNHGGTVIWNISTSNAWTITGNVTAPNFYTTSDQRKKNTIIPISESIRSFILKDTNTKSYGFIAQELEKENPELVDSSGEYKTVNYNGAICLVIAKLENRIKELENEVTLLRKGGKYETI